jgi:hypothetical protein
LATEESVRLSVDSSLNVRLAAVSGTVDSILAGADVDLNSMVEVVTAFQSADSELEGTITALTSARQVVLSSETSTRVSADSSLDTKYNLVSASISTDLSAEVSRADSAETSLNSRITTVSSSISTDLSAEVSRAGSSEVSLDSRISTVSSSISSTLSSEVSRASSVENSIATDLNTLEARTIVFNGTTNELEVDGGSSSTITLGDAGNSITLGLPDDVTIGNNLTVSNNLVVNGAVTLGNAPADLVKVQG